MPIDPAKDAVSTFHLRFL